MPRQPLAFEPRGSAFLARGAGYGVRIDAHGATLALSRGRHRAATQIGLRMVGAISAPPQALRKLPGVINEYVGPRGDWRTGVPTFRLLRLAHVYHGIDALYRGQSGQLEYEFQIAPGADPHQIVMQISGSARAAPARHGAVVIHVRGGVLREQRPLAYQRIAGRLLPVSVRYLVHGGRIRFRIGRYDHRSPLLIDPVLAYSSYFGGSTYDQPYKIVIGGNKDLYLTGYSNSSDLPGAHTGPTGGVDAFVTVFDPTGKTILWTTYVGGSGTDVGQGLTTDPNGGAWIVGYTNSSDFPSGEYPTPDSTHYPAVDTCSDAGTNAFLTGLNSSGALFWSTCFGGSGNESAYAVALRHTTSIFQTYYDFYVVGDTSSSDFPVPGGLHTTYGGGDDAFLTKVRLDFPGQTACAPCTSINYSTYMGGTGAEYAYGVTLDSSGDAFVAGRTTSATWSPTSPLGTEEGDYDGYVAKVNSNGTWAWGRFLGGSQVDEARAVAIEKSDGTGTVVVAGDSNSATNFPGSPSDQGAPVAPDTPGHSYDMFVSRVASDGSSVQGTDFIGGTGDDYLWDMAWHASGGGGSMTLVGQTTSSTLTTVNGVAGQSCTSGTEQVLLVKYDPFALPRVDYATCFGGTGTDDAGTSVAVDTSGGAWFTGNTASTTTTSDALQATYGGGSTDGFLAHVVQKPPTITAGPQGIVSSPNVQFTWTTDEQNMTYNCSQESGGNLTASLVACGGVSMNYNGLADGPQTFQVQTVDGSQDVSAPATQQFTVDTDSPSAFDLMSPADAATTGTTPTFTWSPATDTTAVTYQLLIDGSKVADVPASACDASTCTAQAPTPLVTGPHKWSVLALDSASPPHTQPSTSTRNFTVFDPPTARLTVTPNPVLVGHTVSLDATASADATHTITKYEWDLDGDGTFERDTGATGTTTTTFSKAGTFNVGLRVTDASGASATTTVAVKVSDLTSTSGAPIGVSINHGDQYTNHTDVTLTVVSPAGSTALLVSNDGGFVDAKTFPVASGSAFAALAQTSQEIAWTLDSAGPERLPKTVYVRFVLGTFQSPNYTDDIILDTRPPVVQSASVVGGATGASVAALRKWKVRVKAKDDNSGVGGVQVAVSKRRPGRLINYTPTVTAKLGARPQFVRARDRAGNFSPWKKLR